MSTVKEKVRQLADTLPDDATWEQVRYELYVREQIEAGEKAIAEGSTVPHEELVKRFTSPPESELEEEADDLRTFAERRNEPTIAFAEVVRDLRRRGRI